MAVCRSVIGGPSGGGVVDPRPVEGASEKDDREIMEISKRSI